MRGKHRRRRAPRRLVLLRVAVALAVPVFLVVQPTGASSTATRVLATHALTTLRARHATSTTAPTSTTLAPTTTSTTELVAPTLDSTTAPTTVRPRHTTPTTWGADAAPVALTFDDGPNETYTPQILDILARYGVHATFFMVGSEVEQSPALAHRVLNEGHTVGNHTWDHADLTTLDEEGFRQQVDRTEEQLNAMVGGFVGCVRPPFGKRNAHVYDEMHARGLRIVMWSKDTEDWARPGTDAIVQRALAGAKPGAVILFHDSGPDMSQTVEALPAIIEGIRARGLRMTSICAPGAPAPPVADAGAVSE